MSSQFANNPILVTGGAGFIGSAFCRSWFELHHSPLVVLDKLTYAGNLTSLESVLNSQRLSVEVGDIGDRGFVKAVVEKYHPRAIVNLAAESHVDRSITDPSDFVMTNVVGTFQLLETAREYWSQLGSDEQAAFRFVNGSTDEVYGTLGAQGAFCETSPYGTNSPYSASKASADHFVRAYFHTYGLPTITTNCSNNYGPYQFPEKLIPTMILNGLAGKPLPVYGDGLQVRDWLHVEDHCAALRSLLHRGRPGEVYNIGGNSERTNLQVVQAICDIIDAKKSDSTATTTRDLITFVADRPGHDRRYAIDHAKITREVGWKPEYSFADGLQTTVQWYIDNPDWTRQVTDGSYRGQRLGIVR